MPFTQYLLSWAFKFPPYSSGIFASSHGKLDNHFLKHIFPIVPMMTVLYFLASYHGNLNNYFPKHKIFSIFPMVSESHRHIISEISFYRLPPASQMLLRMVLVTSNIALIMILQKYLRNTSIVQIN